MICLFASISLLPAQAPEGMTQASFWLNLGTGFSFAGEGPETSFGGGGCGRIGLGFQKQKWMLHLRYTGNTGGVSTYQGLLGGNLKDFFVELALMGGYAVSFKENRQVVVSTGLSRVSGSRVTSGGGFFGRSGSSREFDPVVGLPLEVGIIGGRKKWGRIAFYFQGNFNAEEPFWAVNLCGNFGWFPR